MTVTVTHIEDQAAFKALLAANKFVIADFYADWCGPCKAIAPLYAKLAGEHGLEGGLAFAKINVDTVPAVAQEYSVSAMPSFLFFADGNRASINVAPRKAGATPESEEADPASKKVVDMIRGADPRALTAAVTRLGEAARLSAE
ncbi:MAG: hypothetical protein STHCBS139747_004873 [Sporothrix thermara]